MARSSLGEAIPEVPSPVRVAALFLAYEEGNIESPTRPGGQRGRNQRQQMVQPRRKRRIKYVANRERILAQAKKRWRRVRRNPRIKLRKKLRRKYPKRYERKPPRKYDRSKKAEGITFTYEIDDNPANSEIKQPGKDVNYRAVGPTTYTFSPDDESGVMPGHHVPNQHLDDVPPASSRVVPDSMRMAAAKIPEILGNTGSSVMARVPRVNIRPGRFSPKTGIWTFAATGEKGERYVIRVKAIRKGNVKSLEKASIKVSCSCPYFRWQGPEHWAKVNGYLYGRPKGTASLPVVKDPKGTHWVCKHAAAALQMARKYRLSTTGVRWSLEGPVAPLPDPVRVVVRYLRGSLP